MDNLYNTFCNTLEYINSLLWGSATIILILFVGIFLTVRIGFLQFLHPIKILRGTLFAPSSQNMDNKNGISCFQALSTVLAASMGTGNIIGVATAISIGGSGAVFWMVLSAFFVMACGFTETVLGVKYKSLSANDKNCYGPMLYIEKGLHSKPLAMLYAAACLLASFGMGNATQANAISSSLDDFNIPVKLSGVFFAILIGVIIFNGGKFIVGITEKIIPVISLFYIVGAIAVIVLYGNNISSVLNEILNSAFGLKQVAGGIAGQIIKQSLTIGLRRGLFSNEAGMGSAVFAHTSVGNNSPTVMGMWAILEVFIDTVLCCTLTSLVILCTGADHLELEGADIVITAFRCGFGKYAGYFVALSNTIFAFASILGWYYYGEKCTDYLSPNSGGLKFLYRLLYTFTVYIGAVSQLAILWELSDIFNALMMFPNLAAILILSKEVKPYCKLGK